MWDGHFGLITASGNSIKMASDDVKFVHSAPYQAGPTARQFTANEIDRTLKERIIESSTTE